MAEGEGQSNHVTFGNIRIAGRIDNVTCITDNSFLSTPFKKRNNAEEFFRPGQVFMLQVRSIIERSNHRPWREVDFDQMPLEPVANLKESAEAQYLEDRRATLAQVLALPLREMIAYAVEKPGDRTRVCCILCSPSGLETPLSSEAWMLKFEWVEKHFRFLHWKLYSSMAGVADRVPESRLAEHDLEHDLDDFSAFERGASTAYSSPALPKVFDLSWSPHEKEEAPESLWDTFEWISLSDITEDCRLSTDRKVFDSIGLYSLPLTSLNSHRRDGVMTGPALIRRFIVVEQGDGYSLCIGIHT